MVCRKCGEPLISAPFSNLWCAKCSDDHILYSKEETKAELMTAYKICVEVFLNEIIKYNFEDIIEKFNDLRNMETNTFIHDYFYLTLAIGLLLKRTKLTQYGMKKLTITDIEDHKRICEDIYHHKHHLYYTKFDAVRYVKHKSEKEGGIKYTENWLPILKRLYMMGSLPKEPDITSKYGSNLYREYLTRKAIMEDLHDVNRKYSHITETLEILQNYHFMFPWKEYIKIGRTKERIDFFLGLSRKLISKDFYRDDELKAILNKDEWMFLEENLIQGINTIYDCDMIEKDNYWNDEDDEFKKQLQKGGNEFFKDMLINSIDISRDFPLIIELNKYYFVPNYFLARLHQIYNIFSEKNSFIMGSYRKDLGNILEDKIFNDMQVYNLNFKSPIDDKQRLLRYPNPYKTGTELFDVGFIDDRLRKFYVIECKNKTQFHPRMNNPKILNESIRKEFEKFRDRDLPDIKKTIIDWGLNDYEIIPMFYNFVPLLEEFDIIDNLSKLDDIYIIQGYAEIQTILHLDYQNYKFSFYDVYNIPNKLEKIIKKESLNGIQYHELNDVGHLIGEPPERLLITKGEILGFEDSDYLKELTVKVDRPPYYMFLDVPPELWVEIKESKLEIGDNIYFLLYRIRQYSSALILARFWKE